MSLPNGPQQRRSAHSVTPSKRHVSSAIPIRDLKKDMVSDKPVAASALSCLPISVLIRSYLISVISSTPALLTPSLKLLSIIANSYSPVLNPDKNPVLRAIIKYTIYKQFCAGTNAHEVHKTLSQLQSMGFTGVILGYAKEVVLNESETKSMNDTECEKGGSMREREEVGSWETGTLKTIDLASPGDFVALKFSGAGVLALSHLMKNCPPTPLLESAIVNICEKARQAGVRLLFDAEQAAVQDGIDAWALEFMKRYNKPDNPDGGRALIYNTYQAYRTRTPSLVAEHMKETVQGGWRLGVKLVRGAYIGSDPRHLFWATKEETDDTYNGIAKSLMERKHNEVLKPLDGADQTFPMVDLVLAGHNSESVNKAMAFRDEQTLRGAEKTEMSYGQLMGMADHVSCALIQKARMVKERSSDDECAGDEPNTFKYIVWGTVGECTKYLLRRAQENKDAVERTVEGRIALGKELKRRMGITRA